MSDDKKFDAALSEATFLLRKDRCVVTVQQGVDALRQQVAALTEENARLSAVLSKCEAAIRRLAMRLDSEPGNQTTVAMWLMLANDANAALSRLTAGETPKPRRSEMELDEALFCGAAGETPEPPAPTCTCDASGTDVAAAHDLDCRKAHTPPPTGDGE